MSVYRYQHGWVAWGQLAGTYPAGAQDIPVVTFPLCERTLRVWHIDIVGRPTEADTMSSTYMRQWYYDCLGILWTVRAYPEAPELACGSIAAPPLAVVSINLAKPLVIRSAETPLVTVQVPPKWLGRPQGWQVGCTLLGTWGPVADDPAWLEVRDGAST